MAEIQVSKTASSAPAQAPNAPMAEPEAGRHPLLTLRQEMDRLFDDFLGGFSLTRGLEADPWRRLRGALGAAYPTVDATETDKDYQIAAELPGMTEKDVEVTLANGMLTVKGAKNETKEEHKKDYLMSERRYGSFQRSFRLPEDADPERIEATLKNGVLSVVVPKRADAQAQRRTVEIKAA